MTWPCRVRFAEPSDLPLILDSWIEQIAASPPLLQSTSHTLRAHREMLRALIAHVPPRVACHPEYSNQIYGWICAEHRDGTPVLHQIYVRSAFRSAGLGGTLMLAAFPDDFRRRAVYTTHLGSAWHWREKPWKLVFQPYLVSYAYQVTKD